MVLRNGMKFGRVSTCNVCEKRFKYVISKDRKSSAPTCNVCKPCHNARTRNVPYGYEYEGYLFV